MVGGSLFVGVNLCFEGAENTLMRVFCFEGADNPFSCAKSRVGGTSSVHGGLTKQEWNVGPSSTGPFWYVSIREIERKLKIL